VKTAQLKLISALVPYISVLIGLYVLKKAWVAIGLYHFGLTAFVVLTATAYIWRYLASRLKGLAVPLLAHIAADVSIMAATFFLIR